MFSSSISLSSCLYLRSIAHSALLCTDILRFSLVNDDRRRNKRAEIIVEKKTFQGTGKEVLNSGVGHISETAKIGGEGNCVLCGHNGSRYGTFFTPLNQVKSGDEVQILDKEGQKHIYEVTGTDVIAPNDNSIKAQGKDKELTLFTCAEKGTRRFVVKCRYKGGSE